MKGKKIAALLLSLLLLMGGTLTPAAADAAQDGLQVALTCGQERYEKGQQVELTAILTNTNDFPVQHVELDASLPEHLAFAAESRKHTEAAVLEAGETLELGFSAIARETAGNPSTGDRPAMVLGAVLLCGACVLGVFLLRRNQKAFRLLAVLLCVSVTLPMLQLTTFAAAQRKQFTVSNSFTYGGQSSTVQVTVRYDSPALVPAVHIDASEMGYDTDSGTYLVSERLPALTGTVESSYSIETLSYEVKLAQNGYLLGSGELPAGKEWRIDPFGLMLGKNLVTVTATDARGNTGSETIAILNTCEENMDALGLDQGDDDGDGLLNAMEAVYGTDPNNPDTDGDGLTDYQEVAELYTDPLKADTDDNGILDGDEDFDRDGLKNIEECKAGSNPFVADSDFDGLDDLKETQLGTDPGNPDTDGDGISDGKELELGLDPLKPDSNGDGVPDGETPLTATTGCENLDGEEATVPTVSVEIDGKQADSLRVQKLAETDKILNNEVPGFLGEAYDFHVDGEIDSGSLRFAFDESLLRNADFVPAIYYYNEETQLLEELPGQTVQGNTVSAPIHHFSKYLLLDKKSQDEIWKEEVMPDVVFLTNALDMLPESSEEMQQGYPEDSLFANTYLYSWMDSTQFGLYQENGYASWGINCYLEEHHPSIQMMSLSEIRDHFTNPESDKKPLVVIRFYADWSDCVTVPNDGWPLPYSPTKNYIQVIKADRWTNDGWPGSGTFTLFEQDPLGGQVLHKSQKFHNVWQDFDGNYLDSAEDLLAAKYVYQDCRAILPADIPVIERLMDQVISQLDIGDTDRETDANEDGISDYYARRLKEGTLTDGTGAQRYKDIDFDENPDLDNDGLKNGEELVIRQENGKTYACLRSDPIDMDTDGDGIIDGRDSEVLTWNMSDRDYAMFAKLAYLDSYGPGNYEDPSLLQYASPQEVMNDWELVESITMRPAHTAGAFGLFSANVFKNDKQVVLAFRGTSEWQEWGNDALFPVGTPEANCAVSFGTQMATKYRDCKIYVTGHSLGGYLAQVGAAAAAYAGKPVERVVNFNGLGMPPPLIGQKYRNYIQNSGIGAVYACYRIQHDPVSIIGKQLQTPVTLALAPALQASGAAVPKKVKEIFNAKASHNLASFFYYFDSGWRSRTDYKSYVYPYPETIRAYKGNPG